MTTMANVAYVAQYVGFFIAAVILVVSALLKWYLPKSPVAPITQEWKPIGEYSDHRHYLGGLVPSKAMDAQYERQVNELRRHCRIGKIILKERA